MGWQRLSARCKRTGNTTSCRILGVADTYDAMTSNVLTEKGFLMKLPLRK